MDSRYSVHESEYLAEETIVTIVSNVNHPTFRFISGNYGPLESGMPCKVPLWLAITLRKRGKCTIKQPSWLNIDHLENAVNHERNQRVLSDLPFFYVEIAKLLLHNAIEDIDQPDKVASLIQDLENIRMDRIRIGVGSIAEAVLQNQSVISTSLNNVASIEINAVRDFFLQCINTFLWLSPPNDALPSSTGRFVGAENAANPASNNNTTRKLRRFRNNNNNNEA